MSITLSLAGTTLALSDRLAWTDEFSWSPVQQAMEYSTTGVPLIDLAVKQAGRPITLAGKETATWLPRATCVALEAWAALPAADPAPRRRRKPGPDLPAHIPIYRGLTPCPSSPQTSNSSNPKS